MPEITTDSIDASIFDDTVFARVVDDKLMEYPVLYKHIVNREGPKSQFKQVVFGPKPSIDPQVQKLTETIELVKGVPTVTYKAEDLSIDEILAFLWRDKETLTAAQVPLAVFKKISQLTDALATKALDEFAQTRRYANIASLATYVNDPLEDNRNEALRGVALRSEFYAVLKQFEIDVASGARPVPKTFAEISVLFPELTW